MGVVSFLYAHAGPGQVFRILPKQCRHDKSIPDHSAVDSGTPPGREAEVKSTGERRPSIPRREDTKIYKSSWGRDVI
ncbi:unnamed protein product [Caretta caretta]